jgi:hypothetical protein
VYEKGQLAGYLFVFLLPALEFVDSCYTYSSDLILESGK